VGSATGHPGVPLARIGVGDANLAVQSAGGESIWLVDAGDDVLLVR
jgi:hypothetical protein